MPDLYKYEFDKSEITEEIGLNLSNDDLADFFSKYMFGTLRDFQLTAELQGREKPVFGIGEIAVMSRLRSSLNQVFFVLCAMLAMTLFVYGFSLRKNLKEELRQAYKRGVIFYICFVVACCIMFYAGNIREQIFYRMFFYTFQPDDILPALLLGSFVNLNIITAVAVSAIILAVGASVTWRLTKPDLMFS
jgi:uncharacterized membrane protein